MIVTHFIGTCVLLASLLSAVAVQAQQDLRRPSQNTKEAVEKIRRAPGAIGESLQDLGKAVKTKLVQSVMGRPDSHSDPTSPIDGKAAQPRDPQTVRIGKRDPFRPYTLNVRAAPRRRENLSPLERYELGQLKLVGIVWNTREPKAMVEDSSGLGYVIHVGTPIGPSNGKVKAIRQNEIIIEEFFVDLYGDRQRREVGMRILAESAE
jgi:type IV pilus assembly protein PilP